VDVAEQTAIIYSEAHWRNLEALRHEAILFMEPLHKAHIECLTYGSLARGDVTSKSDIDIFIPTPPDPTIIEIILEREGIHETNREIVQATPGYAAKGYIYVGELRSYSFPLTPLLSSEREFYTFAGSASWHDLESGGRISGVDKRLFLIEPTREGHVESLIHGREGMVARLLHVDTRIVLERVRTLERRQRVGRTGVYLKRSLAPGEGFGEVLEELSLKRPALRRRMI
jgi:predicted nucleotidyltransferase